MRSRVTAERLTLVTSVGRWFHMTQPVFIQRGQIYWVDSEAGELCVEWTDGRVVRHAGSMFR